MGLNHSSFTTTVPLNIGLKIAKNITCRVKNSTYKVMVHVGLKIKKRSKYRVKKCKRTLFLGHLWHICLKLGQSEF